MTIIIPKMFTDIFINNEIVRLNHSISKCNRDIESLDKDISSLNEKKSKEYENKNRLYQILMPKTRDDRDRVEYACREYNETISDIRNKISNVELQKEKYNQQKYAYETQKHELKSLLTKTEEQRTEEHYQRLLKTKNEISTQKISIWHFNAKNETSIEEDYQRLAKQFNDINGYKNAGELASDCNNQYRILKERRLEQECTERQHYFKQELAKELWWRIEQKRLMAEEQELDRIAEKNRKIRKNRIITGIVLSGLISGIVFMCIKIIIPFAW